MYADYSLGEVRITLNALDVKGLLDDLENVTVPPDRYSSLADLLMYLKNYDPPFVLPNNDREVVDLLLKSDKYIGAIKYVRGLRNPRLGLREAKDLVDARRDALKPKVESAPTYRLFTDADDEHIDSLIREEKLIAAIKYTRTVTGATLREAKDYVCNRRDNVTTLRDDYPKGFDDYPAGHDD